MSRTTINIAIFPINFAIEQNTTDSHNESTTHKRKPEGKRQYPNSPHRSSKQTGNKWHKRRNHRNRHQGSAGLHCLRQMRAIWTMRIQRPTLQHRESKTRNGRCNHHRVAHLLCRPQRLAMCPARQTFLFVAKPLARQASRSRGSVPPRRRKCYVRPVEQVFHHQQYARRSIAILEQRTREIARRSRTRCRRLANDAYPCRQYGLAAELDC